MDSFLQKFSLQNLLRQFFCGVVFFVPLWLFSKNAGSQCCTCSVLDITQWEMGTFLLFAALASVIGTIIYHLEKNLYSYPLQLAYEYYYQKRSPWWVCLILLLLILAPMICLALVGCGVASKWMLMVVIGLYMLLASFLLRTGRCRIVIPTMNAWYYAEMAQCQQRESSYPEQETQKRLHIPLVVRHLSTWSDFIHCVQSCCFSWLLGCCVVSLRFAHTTSDGEEGSSFFFMSVIGAALLLGLEMLIDMHRYRFVQELRKLDLLPK